MLKITSLTLAAALATTAATAQDVAGPFSLGVGVGTMGVTIEGAYRINENWGVRVPFGVASADYNETLEGVPYDGKVSIGGVALLADYYTGLGGLRLSAGAFSSNYKVDATATGNLTIGSTNYNAGIQTRIRSKNSVAPMITIGYDQAVFGNLSVTADVGAIFVGGFDVDITQISGNVTISQSDIDAEVAQIRDDASSISAIPYLKLGMAYRF